jgi:hypothetical protein
VSARLIALAAAAALALAIPGAGIAAADPFAGSTDPAALMIAPTAPAPHRNRTTAMFLSIAGTVFALGAYTLPGVSPDNRDWIAGSALVVTPTVGEWWCGEYLTIGMGMRAAGLAMAIVNAKYSDTSAYPGSFFTWLGVAAILAGTVYDIADAPSVADDYNAARIRAAPTALVTPTGTTLGLGLTGTF